MDKIKVNCADLLKKVLANRQSHHDIFTKAQEEYRKDVCIELQDMLALAANGKKIIRSITLPEPQDHTADYDRVISMLQMSVDAIIEIDSVEFDRYVMDNWSWKQQSLAANNFYTDKAKR